MNKRKPGTGFRVTLTGLVDGVLTDPTGSVVTLSLPDGSRTVGTPVKDSTGKWHCDFLVPFTCPAGIGVYRWQSVGTTQQDKTAEKRFQVETLDFS